ncbi:MAG TPA: hypothetical protein VFZ65_19310 [Planctomycetota bacterium]|nr:hypothetical protein [Planctomycetota bacterium]
MDPRRLLERLLEGLVRALHRARLIRGVQITMSSRAEVCWESALDDAGGFAAASPLGFLRTLLGDADCGLVRFLIANGADLAVLRARFDAIAAPADASTALASLMRKSREVVPVQAVVGQHDRRQVLHTIHFLWGFAADLSGVRDALEHAAPAVAALNGESPVWTRWQDAG